MWMYSKQVAQSALAITLAISSCVTSPAMADHGQDPDLLVKRVLRERMAAWDKTLVLIDEQSPNAAFLTYMHNAYVDFNHLLKIVPSVESDGKPILASSAQEKSVEDFPGGVTATFRLGGTQVTTEFVPLMIGRGRKEGEGLALYKVTTIPPKPVQLKVGMGDSLVLVRGPVPALRSNEVLPFKSGIRLEGKTAYVRGGKEQLPVALRTTGEITVEDSADSKQSLLVRLDSGSGYILMSYSDVAERAAELVTRDPKPLRKDVDAYYDRLLSIGIETPEPVLDKAFRHAIYNLEYNWVPPYGWVESCHHWMWMFHMQVTAGAEWIGQSDRSRQCTLTHAEQLMPGGAVPQLSPTGQVHRSFGGSNQFWAWQVRHYWHQTGDLDFAKRAAIALDRVLAQTYKEHDLDGNLLLTWGKQIGNQEDFIATPHDGTTASIEGINMMRTRAELARGLGDEETALLWERRSRRAASMLRKKLWLPDLGRFAAFVDPQGELRLDGQYHTFIYPLIWSIVDQRDGYTSLRHVRDRLTDADGEVYCSNNFPNHIIGTWGMQAGAAQQPWASWGLSAMGLRNETIRPLRAVSNWVFDKNHRGVWPEVSGESAPAYFTPPAGLFLAAVSEALFGLKMDAPAGGIEISPSIPDAWPTAKMNLPEFQVEYQRDDGRFTYRLETKAPLARRLRWKLPPSHVDEVLLDGKPVPFTVEPGVGYVVVRADSVATRKSEFTVITRLHEYQVDSPGSVAEGEPFDVEFKGLVILSVDDRYGVLANTKQTGPSSLRASPRRGLLAPYLKFGRLGQLNFSRRTFFVECRAISSEDDSTDGTRFWLPIDLAILPRYEVAPIGEVTIENSVLQVQFLLRNNTESALQGIAWLRLVQSDFPIAVDIPARKEQELGINLPQNLAALLSIGDNRASIMLPDGEQLDLTIVASQLFEGDGQLASFAKSRLVPLALDEEAMMPDTQWASMRKNRFYSGLPWPGNLQPMLGMEGQTELAVDELAELQFPIPDRRIMPISRKIDRPALKLKLHAESTKKLYLLVYSFLDNHDIFSKVARITIRSGGDAIYSRTLRLPGDVDWWDRGWAHNDYAMGSAQGLRTNRFGLLPKLGRDQSDWIEGLPPKFPQAEYWATSLAVKTPASVVNVVEIDLDRKIPIDSVTIEPVGVDPAFGLLAVLAEQAGKIELLTGTEWMPPARLREPRELVQFNRADQLKGWRLEGRAFSVAASPKLFSETTLNSLVQSGEEATGRAISPVFQIMEEEKPELIVDFQGGKSKQVAGKENLCLQVVDAETGEVLRQLLSPDSHILAKQTMKLEGLEGRQLRLMLIDQSNESGFAWIGLRSVRIATQ